MRRLISLAVMLAVPALGACTAIAGVAGDFGSFVGTTSDARCDRRYGAAEEKQPFCQEIRSTLAGSQFKDDCSGHLQGQADDGSCPAERRIGGCEIEKKNDDHSIVVDWYYDVSDLKQKGHRFTEKLPSSVEEIRAMCADRKRYEDGAHYVAP